MLDSSSDRSCAEDETVKGGDLGPERQQYTVKGVESETLKLMREAARTDGMKIGAWISSRMKEAAFRSLEIEKDRNIRSTDVRYKSEESSAVSTSEIMLKLSVLESRLADITRSQLSLFEAIIRISR